MKERKSTTKLAHHQDQNGHPPFKFAQLFDSEASWDNDQLGDTLHWIRQVVALICGLVCGAIPLIGGIWILFMEVKQVVSGTPQRVLRSAASTIMNIVLLLWFLAISSAIVYGYYALILKVDEEEFGGHGTLLMEGLFASFTLFLLSWIVVYSLGISDS